MKFIARVFFCFLFLFVNTYVGLAQGNWGDSLQSAPTWTSGRVGIGIDTPLHNLDIQDELGVSIGLRESVISGVNVLGEGRIDFFPTQTGNYKASFTVVNRFGDSSPDLFMQLLPSQAESSTRWSMVEGWKGAGLYLGTGGALNPIAFAINRVEKMRIDSKGHVGVGTTTPQATLHVAGDIMVDGNILGSSGESLQEQVNRLQDDLARQNLLVNRLISKLIAALSGNARASIQELAVDETLNADNGGLTDPASDQINSGNETAVAYPNPFNPTVTFQYALEEGDNVVLGIYNMAGQEIVTLVDGFQNAGPQSVEWDGRDRGGRSVPSGTYLYKIAIGDFVQSKTIVYIK